MSRRCDISETGAQAGNNVSHSNRKSRRRFLPNLQAVTLRSDILNQDFKLRITAATLRSIDHNGGFDNYLLKTSSTKLSADAAKIKRKLKKSEAAA